MDLDFVDLPGLYIIIKNYLQQDLVLSFVLCSVLAFIIASLVSRNKLIKSEVKENDNDNMEAYSAEEANEHDAYEKCGFHLLDFKRIPEVEMIERSKNFYEQIKLRRSCRFFSSDSVPKEIIENIVKAAGTAPSGANLQPWFYVVVSSKSIKAQLQEIVEEEEEINYKRRMGKDWVQDLEKFKTNWIKPYLTEAPYVILLFRQEYSLREDNTKQTHYYKELSSAISAAFLLMAIQKAGLVTVTTTPLNCGPKIKQLLNRPNNEKLILLFPVGYPAEDAMVPNIVKKPIHEIMVEV